ncbi:MAG: agmatine deiminase family protein [Polyangiales bacterium]
METSPRAAGFRQPAEWTEHSACWVAWPSEVSLWPELDEVQRSFTAMCRAIASPARGRPGERLEVLVRDDAAHAQATAALAGIDVRFHRVLFGDIWMRDIAPVFLTDASGRIASVRFSFNGWGDKYAYPGDDQVARKVQGIVGHAAFSSSLVCEGGGVESDGAGLCMTTREVVLNSNRNPGLSERAAEQQLLDALGAERIVWLSEGLLNDHTDGHIDNIARFIGKGRALCLRAVEADDPNREVLGTIARTLESAGLEVATLPSPGKVLGRDGRPLPASYLNFYIANASVVVPVFGARQDDAALAELATLFPDREVIGVPAKVLLEEGGTVHCITQQEPARGGGEP